MISDETDTTKSDSSAIVSAISASDGLVSELAELLLLKNWTITTAESCTGGLIAASLTDIAGSSAWFNQGVVTYSNCAKISLLEVDDALIVQHGAVSEPVVLAMAAGARREANANVAVSVSGIAGPGGGTVDKPVGTVWIAWAVENAPAQAQDFRFDGDRSAVRQLALVEALRGTIHRVKSI